MVKKYHCSSYYVVLGLPNRRECERSAVGGRGCPGVAVDHALLTVQAGLGPDCYVLGEAVPDISSRDKTPRGEPLRV
jgi:hypothetical protein